MRSLLTALVAALVLPSGAFAQTASDGIPDSLRNTVPNVALCLGTTKGEVHTSYFNVGLWNYEQRMHGLSIQAIGSSVHAEAGGAMISGIYNMSRGRAYGLQASTLFNYASSVSGVQIGVMANLATAHVRGVQLAGTVNIAGHADGAVQIGITNVASDHMRGVQMGVTNYAAGLNGIQAGFVNIAGGESIRGAQVGFINVSRDTSAVKIGLVNVNPTTRIQLAAFGGNTTKFNVGVRFLNRRLYTYIGAGFYYRGLDDKFSGAITYRAGLRFPIGRGLALSGDIGLSHIENTRRDDMSESQRMYAIQPRVSIEYQLRRKLGLFATGGYSMANYYKGNHKFENKPIIEAGLLIF